MQCSASSAGDQNHLSMTHGVVEISHHSCTNRTDIEFQLLHVLLVVDSLRRVSVLLSIEKSNCVGIENFVNLIFEKYFFQNLTNRRKKI